MQHRSRSPSATDLTLAAAVLVLACTACDWKGGERIDGPTQPLDPPGHWVIQPVHMRVFPTTRFVREGEDTILDAWIELSDEVGDPTKAVGQFRFELLATGGGGAGVAPTRLYSWDVVMLTLEENRLFYDPVTRTYLFRLRVDRPSLIDRRLLLRATFTPTTGRRLETEAHLEPNAPPTEEGDAAPK